MDSMKAHHLGDCLVMTHLPGKGEWEVYNSHTTARPYISAVLKSNLLAIDILIW